MKKLFYTAVAVLAFSGAGFAKGKEVKGHLVFACSAKAAVATAAMETFYEETGGGCFSSGTYNAFYAFFMSKCN